MFSYQCYYLHLLAFRCSEKCASVSCFSGIEFPLFNVNRLSLTSIDIVHNILFLQPVAGILGFAGIATFIRYNDERRVTLKGTVSACDIAM